MRWSEIFRLVILNLFQNKFKVFLTSTGIVVGTATIMLVIAIGTGGRMEVAEQFKNLNAGAIDIYYEYNDSGGRFGGGFPGMGGGMPSGGNFGGGNFGGNANFGGDSGGDGPDMGMFVGFGNRTNTENIILSTSDIAELEEYVPGIANSTISYTVKADTEGGNLEESVSYTVAGVKENYDVISNLELAIGDFLTEENDEYKEKTCVLGYGVAREMFDSMLDAYNAPVYIDNRVYVVAGVLSEMGTVSSGISPDETIFIPYATGIKYLTGKDVSPTITVVAEEIGRVADMMTDITAVLADNYGSNAVFTISDAGSKMEAAEQSNQTLTLLLIAMSVIVFIVGGIGIMNVLFVSVKERTNEIGILKAIGCDRKDILWEFLLEASCISLVGAILGVLVSLGITPIIESFSVRMELSLWGGMLSLVFGVLTGSLFGFYPAYKASRLIPVEALNRE